MHGRQILPLRLGSDYQKYTALLATPDWAAVSPELAWGFEDKRCLCVGGHSKVARGRDADGRYKSAEAARYPHAMNMIIAKAAISLAETRLGLRGRQVLRPDTRKREERLTAFQVLVHSAETQAALRCDQRPPVVLGQGQLHVRLVKGLTPTLEAFGFCKGEKRGRER